MNIGISNKIKMVVDTKILLSGLSQASYISQIKKKYYKYSLYNKKTQK